MAKKIYDILPPKVARNVENTLHEIGLAQKSKRGRAIKSKLVKPQEKKYPIKELFIGGGVICVLLGIYLFTTLPRIDVTVFPVVQTFKDETRLVADKNVTEIDLSQKAIPARYVEEEKESTQKFLATGSASDDGKASGTITVYNKLSPSTPLVLKVGTHFLSDSGKYFITLSRITIPAMQGKTPGSVEVKVQAEESGTDSNIGSSNFSVPKLAGTVYYYGIWAESSTAMTGGFSGDIKKVTDDDIANAKDSLTQKLFGETEASLRSKLSIDDVAVENAITKTVISSSADASVDQVAESFNQSAKVAVSFLVFKKQDLDAYVKKIINNTILEDERYLEKSLNVQYVVDEVDVKAGIIKMGITFSVGVYSHIEINQIVNQLPQKNANEIKELIVAVYPDVVVRTKVEMWPFWVSKAPNNKNRINVSLNFD